MNEEISRQSSRQPGGPGDTASVALFVTCLADIMRPSVARSALWLLQDAGFTVQVPRLQTCCGQPQYNSGDYRSARAIARQHIKVFEPYSYVVLPSGSCAGMLAQHYPKLLEGAWKRRAEALASRVFELTAFLVQVANYTPPQPQRPGHAVAYHDACAGLRELGIREQPRRLLAQAGTQVVELPGRDVCCGFGGTFCAKMPEISAKMADDKLAQIEASGADTVVSGDLGCLIALAGRASRTAKPVHCRHIAEVLCDDWDSPAIGEEIGEEAQR